jgi:hypothetical protein
MNKDDIDEEEMYPTIQLNLRNKANQNVLASL